MKPTDFPFHWPRGHQLRLRSLKIVQNGRIQWCLQAWLVIVVLKKIGWLSLHTVSNIKVCATHDGQTDGQQLVERTNRTDYTDPYVNNMDQKLQQQIKNKNWLYALSMNSSYKLKLTAALKCYTQDMVQKKPRETKHRTTLQHSTNLLRRGHIVLGKWSCSVYVPDIRLPCQRSWGFCVLPEGHSPASAHKNKMTEAWHFHYH